VGCRTGDGHRDCVSVTHHYANITLTTP
jgi:hypothetical protein